MAAEIARIRRVSDTLCTAHAHLRDKYANRALFLDILILLLSGWLVALAFVEPAFIARLTPFGIDPRIWMGLLAFGTFFLTLVQIKTDWKSASDAHRRTLEIYSEVKREAGYLIATGKFNSDACRRVFARYDLASAVGIAIPEEQFLALKQKHKNKVALSRYLDEFPASSLLITRVRFWWRDNVEGRRRKNDKSG